MLEQSRHLHELCALVRGLNVDNNSSFLKKVNNNSTLPTSTPTTFHKWDEETSARETAQRGALWAVAHAASTPLGFRLIHNHIDPQFVPFVSHQAMYGTTLSIKGSCFYVLSLIGRTLHGRALLSTLGWDAPTQRTSAIAHSIAVNGARAAADNAYRRTTSTPWSSSSSIQPSAVHDERYLASPSATTATAPWSSLQWVPPEESSLPNGTIGDISDHNTYSPSLSSVDDDKLSTMSRTTSTSSASTSVSSYPGAPLSSSLPSSSTIPTTPGPSSMTFTSVSSALMQIGQYLFRQARESEDKLARLELKQKTPTPLSLQSTSSCFIDEVIGPNVWMDDAQGCSVPSGVLLAPRDIHVFLTSFMRPSPLQLISSTSSTQNNVAFNSVLNSPSASSQSSSLTPSSSIMSIDNSQPNDSTVQAIPNRSNALAVALNQASQKNGGTWALHNANRASHGVKNVPSSSASSSSSSSAANGYLLHSPDTEISDDHILGHISNLSNHVTQRSSLSALKQLKLTHPKLFSEPRLLIKTMKLLDATFFRLPARRFVLFDLFAKTNFSPQDMQAFDSPFAST